MAIPSINLPMTDKNGRMHPVWYEFLRSFVETTEAVTDTSNSVTQDSIVAGAGLVKSTDEDSPNDVILNVGAGSGITVNANDVNIDINSQFNIQASLNDEVLISDVSDNNNIRKTKISDITNLAGSVGGSDTEIQYNNNGVLGGDTGFTTDGVGSVNITGDLDVDNINLNANSIITTDTNGNLTINPDGTGIIDVKKHFQLDSNIYIYGVGGSPTSGTRFEVASGAIKLTQTAAFPQVSFDGGSANNGNFLMSLGNSGNIRFTSDNTGVILTEGGSGEIPLRRTTATTLTASTTQTQGNGALTADVNEVSTVANANDTVTLPSALAGRYCLVINNGANTLQVFPASGDDLGAGVDTATTITTASRKLFIAYDTTNWEPVI